MSRIRQLSFLSLSIFVLIFLVFYSLSLGSVNFTFYKLFLLILSKIRGLSINSTLSTIIFSIRLPRILLAVLVGASLSFCGSLLQTTLRNPLSEPYIIGTSSGAALGFAIYNIFSYKLAFIYSILLSFLGSFLVFYIVYRFSFLYNRLDLNRFLLIGVMINSFIWAILYIIFTFSRQSLDKVMLWMMGSFSVANYSGVLLIFIVLILSFVLVYPRLNEIDIITLSYDKAKTLGVDVDKLNKTLIFVSVLLTSISVALSGIIGFVGLVIPHISRLIMGYKSKDYLLFSIILGAILTLLSDLLARLLFAPIELPVGIITAFFGVPFFLYLYLTNKKRFI